MVNYREEYCCPKCGWDSADGDEDDEEQVQYSDHKYENTYMGIFENWKETWTCPDCGTKFEVWNGN